MPNSSERSPLGLLGFLQGNLHLAPDAAPDVPAGVARPFGRGEYMDNPDGSWSSEMTYTLQDPTLNAGRATLVPGLWLKDGRPYHASEDEAAQMAVDSLLHWPSFSSLPEAESLANAREAAWQHVPREKAATAAPLFIPRLRPKR